MNMNNSLPLIRFLSHYIHRIYIIKNENILRMHLVFETIIFVHKCQDTRCTRDAFCMNIVCQSSKSLYVSLLLYISDELPLHFISCREDHTIFIQIIPNKEILLKRLAIQITNKWSFKKIFWVYFPYRSFY